MGRRVALGYDGIVLRFRDAPACLRASGRGELDARDSFNGAPVSCCCGCRQGGEERCWVACSVRRRHAAAPRALGQGGRGRLLLPRCTRLSVPPALGEEGDLHGLCQALQLLEPPVEEGYALVLRRRARDRVGRAPRCVALL